MIDTLFVIARFWPARGGAELHTREFAMRLSKQQRIGVAYFCDSDMQSNELASAQSKKSSFRHQGIECFRAGSTPWLKVALQCFARLYSRSKLARGIFHLLMRLHAARFLAPIIARSDRVHVVYNGLTGAVKVAFALAHKHDKPIVFTPLLSFDQNSDRHSIARWMLDLLLQADCVIALTAYEKKVFIRHGISKHKIKVIPVGPLIEPTGKSPSIRSRLSLDNCPIVLFLGRISHDKGAPLLIEAMNKVWLKHNKAVVIFFGPNTESIPLPKDNPRLLTIDTHDQKTKSQLLDACDLVCVPSLKEGLGAVYLEGWSFAKPVVAGKLPMLETVLSHNQNAMLVEFSADSLANTIIRLIECPTKRARLGQAGFETVNLKYNWSKLACSLHKLYQELTPSNIKP